MEILFSYQAMFMVGAFVGALCGRLITFGILAGMYLISIILNR